MAWENLNPIEITLRSSAAADSSAVLRRAAACRPPRRLHTVKMAVTESDHPLSLAAQVLTSAYYILRSLAWVETNIICLY